jgi:hypothetical protein
LASRIYTLSTLASQHKLTSPGVGTLLASLPARCALRA